jgi:ribonucleoside-diphosphate reductase alpha chain
MNLHQCAVVGDKFMRKLQDGDPEARRKWGKLLQKRKATGEPYVMFKGNVNKQNPEAYKKNGLKVFMTNICSEIVLHTDESHSFVCCLSSLNLAKYDEWRDTDLIYTATVFLDGVLEEFIQRAKGLKGFDNAIRSAEKGRALGLGVLGWHTYLQQKGIPFEGLQAQFETRKIFSQMKIESERASRDLATEFGEPLWCRDTGVRNTHLRAIAPTVSNSKLSGNVSSGIEPWAANVFTEQTAKGTFIRKNHELERILKKLGKNTKEVWDKILEDGGSVQGLDFLDEWVYLDGKVVEKKEVSPELSYKITSVKEVFKTFKEINQLDLVKQAGLRQQYIDQSSSLNLAFPSTADPKFINSVHMEAWKQGVKTLYYMRTESVLRGDIAAKATDPNCLSCDG